MRQCKKCKRVKKNSCFYGYYTCKECTKAGVRSNYKRNAKYFREYDLARYRLNIDRIFRHRYSGMKVRIAGNGSHKSSVTGKSILSQKKFLRWCYSEKNLLKFLSLHQAWQQSGYLNKLAPSIDRINNDKGYFIGNLQWLTLSKNSKKYTKI